MRDVTDWLESLGLGRYARAFADSDVTLSDLPHLTDEDLKELGLTLGPRRRLQAAIRALNEGGQTVGGMKDEIPPAGPPVAAEAERRQLTVLFCDLVGSTVLSSRLDPEDMREVLRAYQEACSGVIARYEGYVAKFMGDGVYAYFGYPAAHEDDAERAVTAGLGIVEAVGTLGRDLAVRIGIATGTVAVGDIVGAGTSEEASVIGEAPHLAARLQAIAEPNMVVIGAATYALAGRLFETTELGQRNLKGFATPVPAWSVVRSRPVESRFAARRVDHLTELVGRDEELEILLRRWELTKGGEGQVVLISGEPGIGKSRLVHALRDRVTEDSPYVQILQCSPHHINSAMFPFVENAQRAVGLRAADTKAEKIEKLVSWIRLGGQSPERVAPLFGPALGIDTGDRYSSPNVAPQRQKELLFQAFAERLRNIAAQRPVLYVVEDVHWIDPTSLELLNARVALSQSSALMVVITFRPEFEAPWIGQPHTTFLALNRLDRKRCIAMVSGISGGNGLAEDVVGNIVERTDGVPLFIEELTKAVIESGATEIDDHDAGRAASAVPATLQDALEARLDRLGPAKEIAQIGAVIGRTFEYALISRVAAIDDTVLRQTLDGLVHSGLAAVRGEPPDSGYTFKHALVQETAYASLLRGRRADLHGAVARALEQHFPETMSSEPELLAQHFTEAGLSQTAITYWHEAGRLGFARGALQESAAHFERGLALLEELPDSDEKRRLEVDLLALYGVTLKAHKGVASEEARKAFARAYELREHLTNSEDIVPVLYSLINSHWARGALKPATDGALELIEVSKKTRSDEGIMMANFALGATQFLTGKITSAIEKIHIAEDIHDPVKHAHLPSKYMQDLGIGTKFYRGNLLYVLGYPDRARSSVLQGAELSDGRLPIARASARSFGAFTLICRRDVELLKDWNELVIALSDKMNISQHQGWGRIHRGWVAGVSGNYEDGLSDIEFGAELFRKSGRNTWMPWIEILRCDVSMHAGRFEPVLDWTDAAFRTMHKTGENLFQSPALQMRGDALAKLGRPEAAEDGYQQALDFARAQKAKSWELRAATSLARLWHSQGKTDEARDLLSPVYGWFTEGFDTPDLKEAKALLDALG